MVDILDLYIEKLEIFTKRLESLLKIKGGTNVS